MGKFMVLAHKDFRVNTTQLMLLNINYFKETMEKIKIAKGPAVVLRRRVILKIIRSNASNNDGIFRYNWWTP